MVIFQLPFDVYTPTPDDKGVWAYIFGALSYSSDYDRGPSKVEKKWG